MIETTLMSLDTQMLIGHEVQVINVIHHIIVFLMVEIWTHGRATRKKLLIDQVQKLSIEPWPMPHMKSCF